MNMPRLVILPHADPMPSDYWTPEQAVEFFRGTLQIDAELSLAGRVCHETHRNRGLFTPYRALFVLEHVPE
jgi:hypothetical protein